MRRAGEASAKHERRASELEKGRALLLEERDELRARCAALERDLAAAQGTRRGAGNTTRRSRPLDGEVHALTSLCAYTVRH